MNIKYELKQRKEPVKLPADLAFGALFTDHLLEVDYNPEKGWHNATIKEFSNLNLHPAAMVFHYGQAIFEGLKAYKWENGKVALFRPEKNFERLNASAKRLCMPEMDVDFLVESLKELVKIDKDWIPTGFGQSLYIRPFMISTDPFVGVRPSNTYKYIVILSPVGLYYPQGLKPVPIQVTEKYVRAVRKGVGNSKVAGNYAASLIAQVDAKKDGYAQVLWLDAIEQKYIEEVGTSNIFIRFKDEIATPELSGSILPGITRMSTIEVLKEWGMNINERKIEINEVYDAYDKGNLVEIFGTGTAAIISPVGKLKFKDREITVSTDKAGELAQKVYDEIVGIQLGKNEDKRGWITFVE